MVGVVGAGAAGLAAARHLLAQGFEVELLDRARELGGVWNYGRPQGRVCRSTHTISSKPMTQFPDFPMPDHYPDYPHHSQVLVYVRDYAERFGLTERIRFETEVTGVEPEEPGRRDTGWRVETDGERHRYAAVVIANGHNYEPRRPEWPGQLDGLLLHSADYRTPDILADRRVLVVGAGNSGCDIAVEAAGIAGDTMLSMRRGYHYVPKYLLGRPADQVNELALNLRLPLALRRWIARQALRLGPGLPESVGLPEPDHALFESHPIVNSLLPYYVRHGRIRPVADVERLDGDVVRLVDGTSEPVDVLIAATGYRLTFPFIDRALLNWGDGRPRLHRHVFHPDLDTLFVAGMVQTDSGVFRILDEQARCIALFLRAVREDAPVADRLRERKRRVDVDTGGIRYRDTPRHRLEVEHWSYLRGLEKTARMLEGS
jgi:hypothetical protein